MEIFSRRKKAMRLEDVAIPFSAPSNSFDRSTSCPSFNEEGLVVGGGTLGVPNSHCCLGSWQGTGGPSAKSGGEGGWSFVMISRVFCFESLWVLATEMFSFANQNTTDESK